ncbi:MAG: UPF0175 family protein [Rhodocyclaceae bacterium]|nr:UPF0175 family protein [Rhodocyclaceae bacterium]
MNGIGVAPAVKLFDEEKVTVAQAAKLAGMSLSEFIDLLGGMRISVARYASGELEQEVGAFG